MSGHALSDRAFGLYVHWPFCEQKCPYCDFNSHVRNSIDQAAWRTALLADMAHQKEMFGGKPLSSIFFGGGTPSLMQPDTVAAVIDAARGHWGFADGIEITLEANPSSVEAGKFRAFSEAGVNRLSLGVQSFHDDVLRFLGRVHDAGQARRALDIAGKTFERFSFDLIYARPGQTVDQWRDELSQGLSYGSNHVSLYQLTIEKGTPFYAAWRNGDLVKPDEDISDMMFDATQDMCEEAGLPAYEISNHARPGQESRHNLLYWRYGDYAGIGPGAHGRLLLKNGVTAFAQKPQPEDWLSSVRQHGHGLRITELLSTEDIAVEFLMMGLRLTDGVRLDHLEALTGKPWQHWIYEEVLADLLMDGFMVQTNGTLAATAAGRRLLNPLLARLIAVDH